MQWAKLEALAEGARLASRELWGSGRKKAAAKKKAAPKKRAAKPARRKRAA
jgi:5-methyltetrahydropteroyltriglutamate--homocysteine methyltransferase